MDTAKKDKVIKPRNFIKNDVVLKTYKIYNYKYKLTPERVAIVNRCYLPHLLVWWDADMLIYHDGVLHIKEHPEVIIFDEGSYRTYSDGIMMSDCKGGIGRYNFVRTGDDAIEFKGTGWWEGKTDGSGCLYEQNDLWTDKGAGYCLTWEAARGMSNMTFRNNSIGFAQSMWTSRCTAIDCLLGNNASSEWSDIVFENIEIYCVRSPNVINVQIQGEGGNLKNVTFKNITVKTADEDVFAFRMHDSAKSGTISNIMIDHFVFCGVKMTLEHAPQTVSSSKMKRRSILAN